MIDEILTKFNLKYSDLSRDEVEVLHNWLSALQENSLTVDKIRDYLQSMKGYVEDELTRVGHESKQDVLLKARLRNYMLLEAFLTSPDKARKQMENALAGMVSRIKN